MANRFTLKHAMQKSSWKDLKGLAQTYMPGKKIDPSYNKNEIINELADHIPETDKEGIIYEVFGKPKTRYLAHIGLIDESVEYNEKNIKDNCDDFNLAHDFKEDIADFEVNVKEEINLDSFKRNELLFTYNKITKRPEFDYDTFESKLISYSKRVRIEVSPLTSIVSIFTGDRDLFNEVLSSLTLVFGKLIRPLSPNKTGITEVTKGSFSFHTVKALDYIYHGLSQLGTIGSITHIELETPTKSEKAQSVTVRGGDDLLDDKSICEYLFVYGRDLIGVKLNIKINSNGLDHLVNVQVGIRDNRVKIGIKKEKYSIEMVKEFYRAVENNIVANISQPGLIDEKKLEVLLDKIRKNCNLQQL
ncbi:hypothetical protein [Heyndrickxia faecalis]|uniref:hypothetical protein n=1 Tax=Heyndrickxia faecalis TaxID=2824910 RepID=UPI003D1B41BF